MKTIYKYRLDTTEGVLKLPAGAKFLSVQTQEVPASLGNIDSRHVPCVWALVNPDAKKISYSYKLIGTGWDIEDDADVGYEFVGTVQTPTAIGLLVWHLFIKEGR